MYKFISGLYSISWFLLSFPRRSLGRRVTFYILHCSLLIEHCTLLIAHFTMYIVYQICTRISGARYILSPGFIPNAL